MLLNPTRQLMEDHEWILQVLDKMEKATQSVAEGAEVQLDLWDYFVRFSCEFSDGVHHHKEEKLLFPMMVRAGLPLEDGPIACMLGEHETGREYIRKLALALEKYKAGKAEARMEIIENASEYIYLLRQHITKENHILFSMAERLLSLTEKRKLTDQICQWVSEEKNRCLEEAFRSRFLEVLSAE